MYQLVTRVLAVLAVAAASLILPVQPAQTVRADSVETLQRQVAKLRDQAALASASLRKSTERYEAGKQRLGQTRRRLLATAQGEQRARDKAERAHDELVRFAVSAYQGPAGDEVGALLQGSLAGTARTRSTVDLSYLAAQQAHAVTSYRSDLDRQRALHRQAKKLQRSAAAQQRSLASQQERLQAESRRITGHLLTELDRLTVRLVQADRYKVAFRVSRERLGRSGRDTASCEKPTVRGFPNGLIPQALLCPLPQRGEYLRADAARAFWLLDTAYRLRFGSHICVTDGYRPLSQQYAVYRTKPGLAAVPGTSRHGLGIAVDLGCGIQNFGSTQFRWMKRNASKFDWVHPSWAETTLPEPWHWEYQP